MAVPWVYGAERYTRMRIYGTVFVSIKVNGYGYEHKILYFEKEI